MNGVMAEDSLATSVSMPTATDSSNATQNKISVSDTRVRVFFFLQNSNKLSIFNFQNI